MYIHLRTFNIILMILLLNPCCGELVESCSKESREQNEMCGKYCYKVVKPLLGYAASVRSKEEQFGEMQNKNRDQEVIIVKLEKTIQQLEYEYHKQVDLNDDSKKNLQILTDKVHDQELYILKLNQALTQNELKLQQRQVLIEAKEKQVLELQNKIRDIDDTSRKLQCDDLNDVILHSLNDLAEKTHDQVAIITKLEKIIEENIEKKKQFDDLQSKVHDQEVNMVKLNETLKQNEIQQRMSNEAKIKEVGDLQNKISDQKLTISKLEKNIQETENKHIEDIQDKKKKLKTALKQNEELQQQCALNDAMVRELQNNIQNQKETLEFVSKQNKEQAAIVAGLQQKYESNSDQIVQLRYKVNAKDIEIKKKDTQLYAKDTDIKNKDTQLASHTAKINELNSKLSELQSSCVSSNCLCKSTDVHMLYLPNIGTFSAPCDSTLVDSGWTVIQRRVDGSVNFNRNWYEYKEGFGDLHGEFFLGLEKLHALTQFEPHELYIYLEDFDNDKSYAKYSHFLIGDETESYKLKILGEYDGNAGDSLSIHINMKFSTKDQDNDTATKENCAKGFESGWWFLSCYRCNLNGKYSQDTGTNALKIAWHKWHLQPIKFVQMMIRPKPT